MLSQLLWKPEGFWRKRYFTTSVKVALRLIVIEPEEAVPVTVTREVPGAKELPPLPPPTARNHTYAEIQ
jgi:hypothetical protein